MIPVFRRPSSTSCFAPVKCRFAPVQSLTKMGLKSPQRSVSTLWAKAGVLAAIGAFWCGSSAMAAPGFTVSGSNLKDANGNNFYPRGINNPHIWFDADAYNALPGLASRKTNCIRVVWTTSGSASRLDQILSRCEALKMIPMVESHNATGSNDPDALNAQAQYWARSDVAAVLKAHERYVLINIANEWSNYQITEIAWRDAYKRAVNTIRDAGLTTTIVVDGPNYGQRSGGIINYGQELLNSDPQHNLLFSIHMYAGWNTSSTIPQAMATIKSKNLPLVIGEFGYNFNNGTNNLGCKVDPLVIMQSCLQYGYGYIAWSTKGNNSDNAWLDLTSNWSSLTSWGDTIFNSPNGITNTAQMASVFYSSSGSMGGGASAIGPVVNGLYTLQNRASGKNLDSLGPKADGAIVSQWDASGSANQQWKLSFVGGGFYQVVCQSNGKALDSLGHTADNSTVGQTTLNGEDTQLWSLVSAGGGYYKLVNRASGKCLDSGGDITNGAAMEFWGSGTTFNQQWKLVNLDTLILKPEGGNAVKAARAVK